MSSNSVWGGGFRRVYMWNKFDLRTQWWSGRRLLCIKMIHTHTHEICVYYTISIHDIDIYYACVYKRNMDRRRATECSTIHNARASRTSWLNSPGCRAMPPIHTTIREYYIANDIIHFYCVKRDTTHRRTVASRQLLMLRRIWATTIR